MITKDEFGSRLRMETVLAPHNVCLKTITFNQTSKIKCGL